MPVKMLLHYLKEEGSLIRERSPGLVDFPLSPVPLAYTLEL